MFVGQGHSLLRSLSEREVQAWAVAGYMVPARTSLSYYRRIRAAWYVFSSCGAEKSIPHPGWGEKKGTRNTRTSYDEMHVRPLR